MNRLLRSFLRWFALMSMLAVAGCAVAPSAPSAHDPNALGTLIIDGSEAFLNEQPASYGSPIYSGDTVRTGPATSVKILLRGGGYVQLDENTDPLFSLISEGACILIQVAQGQVFVEAKKACLETDELAAAMGSRVNLSTRGGESVLTVLSGNVEVTRPTHEFLHGAERYVARGGSGGVESGLTAEQLAQTTDWTRRYFPPGRPVPPPTPYYPPTPPPHYPPTPPAGGWCCSNGSVFPANSSQCAARRGAYYRNEVDAAQACRANDVTRGFCCSNGSVFEASQGQCAARRGDYYSGEIEADRACRPPVENQGWCCSNGSVSRAARNQCNGGRGGFYTEETSAARACRVPSPPDTHAGWCCNNGSVSRATRNQCAAARGALYTDEGSAGRACRAPPPPVSRAGWCCGNGSVSTATSDQCAARQGRFFTDQTSANRACRASPPTEVVHPTAHTGWCCRNGSVFESAQNQCITQHGRYYNDRNEASSGCTSPVQ